MLIELGFVWDDIISQLFLLFDDSGILISILTKLLNDLLLAGIPKTTSPIIEKIYAKFNLETIAHGPDVMSYFVFHVAQLDAMSVV